MAFIKELCITQYRGILNLKIKRLNQVNLIVGDNNCGKTSVLEAIQLLCSSGKLADVYKVARQREALSSVLSSNSIYDNLICMFPRNNGSRLEISITGICNQSEIAYKLSGKQDKILVDPKETNLRHDELTDIPDGELEAEAFEGDITLYYNKRKQNQHIVVNQYSKLTGTVSSDKDVLNIVYVSPFAHLRGSIINKIIRYDSYKQICIKAMQLFDPDIEDMMIFRSDIGNRPVEYIRHRKLGDMPLSTFGDGIKKVLAISNAIAQAAGGILLFDEVETSIHKKYYDDIFRFIMKACKKFDVQLFISTHSIEAIDGILAAQDYDTQDISDDVCVCTLKKTEDGTFSRVLSGREVFENRAAFGFEVRL